MAATIAAAAALAVAATGTYTAFADSKKPKESKETYSFDNVTINGGGFVPGIVFNETEPDLIYARTDIGGVYRWQESSQTWKPLLDWVGNDHWGYTGVVSVATDPVDTDRVYAAVGTYTTGWDPNNGAILYSDDRGETWGIAELPFKQGGNMPGRGMGERLVVDPSDNATLYLGAPSGNGLWKSTDYGRTWAEVTAFPNPGNFVVDPNNDYLADNQGVIWIKFVGDLTYVGVADPADPLYVSSDSGATWEAVPGAAEAIGRVGDVDTIPIQAVVEETTGELYIGTSWDPGPYNGPKADGVQSGQVWKLDTGTGDWTDVTPDLPAVMEHGENVTIPGFGGLTIDRQNPGTIMVATNNTWWPDVIMFRTTDGGETWQSSWDIRAWSGRADRFTMDITGSPWLTFGGESSDLEYTPKHGWMVQALSIDPHDSDRLMYGTGATIYGTTELTKWDAQGDELFGEDWPPSTGVEQFTMKVMVHGLEETSVLDLIKIPGGPLVSGLGDIGGFVHTSLDEVPMMHQNPYAGNMQSLDFAELNTDVIVRAGNAERDEVSHVGVSTDGGASWKPATRPADAGNHDGGKIAVSADGGAIVWAPSQNVGPYVSADLGETWTDVDGLPARAFVRSDRVNPDVFYAWGNDGFYRSTDGGATFAEIPASGLPAGDADLQAVPGHEGHVWLSGREDEEDGTPGGLWHTSDGGQTWLKLDAVDDGGAVGFGKAAKHASYPAIYISSRIDGVYGIFRSIDGGKTWKRINDDQHQYAWTGKTITGDPDVYGRVYFGTNGRGIIYGDTDDTSGGAKGGNGKGKDKGKDKDDAGGAAGKLPVTGAGLTWALTAAVVALGVGTVMFTASTRRRLA
jgi:photosystem II stability/assembly factor-like uncharacterized protein